jgi:glycosyltransferase involved in cell wall biosynthesis
MTAPGTRLRVALVADLLEEHWPSMDLTADMLYAGLRREAVDVSLVRLPMRRRFSRDGDARSGRYTADRLLNRLCDYPRGLARRADAFDVFHVADHSYAHLVHAVPAGRAVVTCHDLDTFRSLLEPESEPRSWPFRAMTRRILSGFQKAARVACNSEATRDAILRHGLLPAERVVVTPLAVHPAFQRETDVEAARAMARRLGDRRGVEILHVGSTIPRKRIAVLLDVFGAIRRRRPDARLVRVGGEFTAAQRAQARRLGLEDGVTVLPRLEWEEVAAVYRRADLVLVTSEREGLGLPVLEALACGTPVIASDIPALRETGGAVTTYCPVGDVEAWAGAALHQLRARAAGDPSVPIEREERKAHARKFAWSECARRMVEIYRDVVAECGG